MLERAEAAGLLFAWITGDSVYGADRALRRWAERHRRGYVLTVTSAQRLGLRSVCERIEHLPAAAWQRLSAGDGAKGPRLYDWARLEHRGGAAGFRCALLVRRSIARPQDVTFYLTHAPEATPLDELVRVAGTRWSIESLFEQAKGEVGLDQYEVRSWVGWHRHITLAMFALAYLSAVRKGAIGGSGPGRPGRGAAADDGAGGSPAALAQVRPVRPPANPLPHSAGQPSDDAISSARDVSIGSREHRDTNEKPGCRTRLAVWRVVHYSANQTSTISGGSAGWRPMRTKPSGRRACNLGRVEETRI